MKKYIVFTLVFLGCGTHNKNETNLTYDSKQKSAYLAKIAYGDSNDMDSIFYQGYKITEKKALTGIEITELQSILRDSTNFLKDDIKNCASVPKYGCKINESGSNLTIFISENPCPKITIIDSRNNAETARDIIEPNDVIAFFERVFAPH